uniref:TATA box binding protein (TBP)-associated factor, RNA polymerase I, A n=3 Tax=Nothobranchius pienaari TaxID=704102 RepID=A0A1A8KZE7_9TELE
MADLNDQVRDFSTVKNLDDGSDSSDRSCRKGHKSTLPLVKPLSVEMDKETGFRRSVQMCLEHIREAMLRHKWQEAADYMASYPQILEDRNGATAVPYKEVVWRICTEILHHHPRATMESCNITYERMKHSGVKLYLTICLEHCFHLLLNGQMEEAKLQLSVAESWRYGKESATQHHKVQLIQAYRSLLDYIIWCDKRRTRSKNNPFDSDHQDLHNYFRQASVHLQEILKSPGVWDPFILSYVEMLEFYGDHMEALNVLNNYALNKRFPPNPNAHVFLYQFLKRHNTPEKKLIKVLKNLHVLVPSHELMLEYSYFLLQSEKIGDSQKALGVLLEMLDFACWRSNLDVWRCLQAVVQDLRLRDDWERIVQEQMASRQDWWPVLHFTSFHAAKDSKENPELWKVKKSLLKILCPGRTLGYSGKKS